MLSPEMCVERKSLSDLRGSLASGRLYHQAEAMSRHYTTPILLIEFERDKAFALHSPSDISQDIQVGPPASLALSAHESIPAKSVLGHKKLLGVELEHFGLVCGFTGQVG